MTDEAAQLAALREELTRFINLVRTTDDDPFIMWRDSVRMGELARDACDLGERLLQGQLLAQGVAQACRERAAAAEARVKALEAALRDLWQSSLCECEDEREDVSCVVCRAQRVLDGGGER